MLGRRVRWAFPYWTTTDPFESRVMSTGAGQLRSASLASETTVIDGEARVFDPTVKTPRLPPRWFIRLVWLTHRGLYRVTGGRLGLRRPKPNGWGIMRLTTIGRRTGQERSVMVGYFEDGPNFVTMAMNGWGEATARRGG